MPLINRYQQETVLYVGSCFCYMWFISIWWDRAITKQSFATKSMWRRCHIKFPKNKIIIDIIIHSFNDSVFDTYILHHVLNQLNWKHNTYLRTVTPYHFPSLFPVSFFSCHLSYGSHCITVFNAVFMGIHQHYPDSKVHGPNMGPHWGRQDPSGPHVGPMNFAIWVETNRTDTEKLWQIYMVALLVYSTSLWMLLW